VALSNKQYHSLRTLFRGRRLPLAWVDLDAFDANVATVLRTVKGQPVTDPVATGGRKPDKTIRLGTKSMRCEPLMARAMRQGAPVFRGYLTFTAEETAWLAAKGNDDFVLAYPTVQPSDLAILSRLTQDGVTVSCMVDCPEHLQLLSQAGEQAGVVISACMEVDLAYRPLGSSLHLGLRRSPIRTPEQAVALTRQVSALAGVRIDAVMGYEGHIAGLADALPGAALKNAVMRMLKAASVRELTRRRTAVIRALTDEGVTLRLVNGGGSGSLVTTLRDPSVTEVTVGSGLYAPGLFHHYKQIRFRPAAFFALQVVRQPAPGMMVCGGGGYVASGPAGADKVPTPVLPIGLRYLPLEGAGEVSTPLLLPPDCPHLELGDPIFFQHAKAGELCERFDRLLLVQDGQIVDSVPTYRGEGNSFM